MERNSLWRGAAARGSSGLASPTRRPLRIKREHAGAASREEKKRAGKGEVS